MGGVVLLKIGCKFVELAPPINLSQHSFCRWLPQHKINCSYIHLKYSSDPELKIYKFKWFRKDLYDETVFPLYLPLKLKKSNPKVNFLWKVRHWIFDCVWRCWHWGGFHSMSCWCMQRGGVDQWKHWRAQIGCK